MLVRRPFTRPGQQPTRDMYSLGLKFFWLIEARYLSETQEQALLVAMIYWQRASRPEIYMPQHRINTPTRAGADIGPCSAPASAIIMKTKPGSSLRILHLLRHSSSLDPISS